MNPSLKDESFGIGLPRLEDASSVYMCHTEVKKSPPSGLQQFFNSFHPVRNHCGSVPYIIMYFV
jgi:hypothetical protein